MSTPSETAATVSLDEAPVFGAFVSGVVLTFGTRLLMLAGVFGSGVIIARRLDDDGFGTYAVLNVAVALAVQIGSAGLPSANTFFLARDRAMLGPIFANALGFALIIGCILTVAVVGLNWLRPSLFGAVSPQLLAAAAVSIPFQLLFLLELNVLLAINRIRQLNFFDALMPAWVLVNAVLVLLVLRERLFVLVLFNSGSAILLSLVLAFYIARDVSKHGQVLRAQPDFHLLKAMLRYGGKFYVSIMAAALIFRADMLIVNRFRGAAEAGVYSVAAQFSFLLLMLPGVIATLLFPRVASSSDQTGEFAVRVTRHTTMIMLILCIGAASISFVLPLIYGAPFADATVQLLMLLPGVFFMGLESVLVQHFTGTGLPRVIPVFWLITLVFNIGLNLLVVPTFGGRGAALTSSLTYALIFILVAVYFCRKTKRGMSEILLWQSGDLRMLRQIAGARLHRRTTP